MNQQLAVRLPATWEANLLAGSLLIVMIVGAGMPSLFLDLSIVLIVGQLLVVVPALLWIAARRLLLRTTLRLHPIPLRTALWSVIILRQTDQYARAIFHRTPEKPGTQDTLRVLSPAPDADKPHSGHRLGAWGFRP